MLGDAYYGCYDETDWPDQPRGKYKGKAGLQKRVCESLLIITESHQGKTSGKHDWATRHGLKQVVMSRIMHIRLEPLRRSRGGLQTPARPFLPCKQQYRCEQWLEESQNYW